jgi:hypothetical protein
MTPEQCERTAAHFLKRKNFQSVALRSKCLLSKANVVMQSVGFVAIFNGANYSAGIGQMLVITVKLAKLYSSMLR